MEYVFLIGMTCLDSVGEDELIPAETWCASEYLEGGPLTVEGKGELLCEGTGGRYQVN